MTQDEIIRMAREAISDAINQHDQMLKRLWCIAYEEGQKAEREACAKVCEKSSYSDDGDYWKEQCAAAIRARSNK